MWILWPKLQVFVSRIQFQGSSPAQSNINRAPGEPLSDSCCAAIEGPLFPTVHCRLSWHFVSMSATRLSALLPLGGILRSPRTRHLGHLGLRLGLAPRCNPTRIAYGEPLLMIRLQQRRHLSYSGDKQSNGQRPPPPPPPPPPTWSASLAAVRRSLNFGPIFNAFRGNNLRRLFKQSPEELVLALVLYDAPPSIALQ